MLWLAVYFPGYLLQYLKSRLDLTEDLRPYALHNDKGDILLCDARAALVGVEVGQSVATACSLCSELQLLLFNPGSANSQDADSSIQAVEWLCQWSYDFSARVVPLVCSLGGEAFVSGSLVSSKSSTKAKSRAVSSQFGTNIVPDTLLLEVGSMGNLFGGLDGLITAYKQRAGEMGLECILALGHTRLSAALQTRLSSSFDSGSSGISPSLAISSEIASSTTASSEFIGVSREQKRSLSDELSCLDKLALSHYPLEGDALLRLAGMGITTLGQLRALPTAELGKRFGTGLLLSLRRLDASMPDPCDYYELPQQYRRELNLLHEVEQFQGLLFPLGRLFAELETYLRQRQQAVLNLNLYLKYRDRDTPPLVLTLNYPFAEHRADGLMALCRLQLERQTLFQPVTDIVLEALRFVEPANISASQSRALGRDGKQGDIRRLQASLQARLGDACVLKLTVADAHLPERANLALPATQPPVQQMNPLSLHACRPCWLLPEPCELEASEVVLLKGPERIDSPWWEDKAVSRDYYLARHQGGGYCWVYRTAEGLFLQGWF
ncbi:DNA polymerase Y family protein [Shewanella corallii]|uniref:DNA polymerase Y family protein n=1 Tax=Shewanella corallii TaxID=560080 RepID=A0ABT0N7F2_9GAMM|nr:DNA polymerase Y family protein [Shewanella corallii]MCL2914020.1 DNA polymerase Y family protein [Shewanella corallii]